MTNDFEYNLFPSFEINDEIGSSFDELADKVSGSKSLMIDGFEGVLWDGFIDGVTSALERKGLKVSAINVNKALKSESVIDEMIAPYMGDGDSIFGRMTDLLLIDFFDRDVLAGLKPDDSADITILYGTGASLVNWDAALIYVDLPKNELQKRYAAGESFNFGTTRKMDSRENYKRSYFIDWPILDSYHGELIPRIDYIVDSQKKDIFPFMSGDAFRKALDNMSHSSFRVRPWFAPGVWGGQYLLDNIPGLREDGNPDNIAWSFELMALENGIIFSHRGVLLEVSFSFLMSYRYKDILGHCADVFKEDFPIRFDFLDTVRGGNLSVQCHPRPEYIRSRFGKKYTQDETYYILQASEDSRVYLGFQEDIDRETFSNALNESQRTGTAIDIGKYVQSFPSSKHDLFLIPNGTIHASGAGNLVLEISSAPYIFTFKMYDWMRLDMDGRPRPINIVHGLNNVRFERKGKVVPDTLLSKPSLMKKSDGIVQEHVPTHPVHFYDVYRYRMNSWAELDLDTSNHVFVWMVVEGSHVQVETPDGRSIRYNYLETFVVPAAAGSVKVTNTSGGEVVLVQAFVKDEFKI